MIQRLSVLLVGAVIISSCATVTPQGDVYRGKYFYNFETAAFTPAGASRPWCVNSAKLKAAELPADGSHGGPWGTAEIVVRGVLSPKGRYCNLGAYEYVLEITEVIEISNRQRVIP